MAETVKIVIDADDRASKTIDGMHGTLNKLGGVVKGLAMGGAMVGAAAIVGLGSALLDSVNAAMEAQEVQAQLDSVLKSTGGAAGVTAEMVNKLASELQQTTRFEDDAVVAAESLLLTFTNIGKDVFPDTVAVMADMSTALGQDLSTSAMQLGKALNDPVAGISALQRVGVTFSEDQKEVIKKLVETGDVAGAQRVILAELNREFGGSAKAAGETFGGQLDILKNNLGEVKEKIGAALIPALSDLATEYGPKVIKWAEDFGAWIIEKGIPALRDFATWFTENVTPALQDVWDWIANKLIPALHDFGNWFETNILPVLEDVWEWITTKLIPALQDFGNWIGPELKKAIDTAGEAIKWINEEIIQPLIKAFETLFSWIKDVIDKFNEWKTTQTTTPPAGNGGSNGVYWYSYTGGSGNSLPMGGNGAPITINVNVAGSADARTMRGAVLDALSLARARGMA